jgi:hypothetical protein
MDDLTVEVKGDSIWMDEKVEEERAAPLWMLMSGYLVLGPPSLWYSMVVVVVAS